uniref:BID domain-containing T4SS effector n=1 Tax=Bartonella queenslandensis TaxID=481138 RepID=UPI00058447FA
MKKSHPHLEAQGQEPLYARVNKPNRGNQRTPNPEEEVLYASVSNVSPSKERHHHQRREEPETDYTTVASPRREEEVVYASVSSVSPSRGRRPDRKSESPETDYTEVAPQQRGTSSSSLTAEQITVMLLKDSHVQAYAQEVVYWGGSVYGKGNIFQQHLQDILTNPAKGKELSDRLAEFPESIHKLTGHSALGIKNQTRKAAEDGFRPLIDAIDGYTRAVKDATTRLLQTPMAEQRRHKENSREAEREHHHDRHHARGQNRESPEHSPQRQRH